MHDLHQTGFVGKGSGHLQLIKLWPSCAPGKGVCGGAKIFGSALLHPAHSVYISLSAFFIIICIYTSCDKYLSFSALQHTRQQFSCWTVHY